MTLTELKTKMPKLTSSVDGFLNANKIPYNSPFFGEATIDEVNAEKALQIYNEMVCAALEKKKKEEEEAHKANEETQEKERCEREEAERLALEQAQYEKEKRRAMAQMLITSGFNFDGYRITKYSGYISGDDAISVDRGLSFLGFGGDKARDELMASLTEIRRNALRELKEAAYDLGCNAVIGVDFDYITLDPQTHNIGGGTKLQPYVFGVTANGNAVIIEKIED